MDKIIFNCSTGAYIRFCTINIMTENSALCKETPKPLEDSKGRKGE